MLSSFSRSPLQACTGDPNDHILVPPARGATPYSHSDTSFVLFDPDIAKCAGHNYTAVQNQKAVSAYW